jgi:hypothetical protein
MAKILDRSLYVWLFASAEVLALEVRRGSGNVGIGYSWFKVTPRLGTTSQQQLANIFNGGKERSDRGRYTFSLLVVKIFFCVSEAGRRLLNCHDLQNRICVETLGARC